MDIRIQFVAIVIAAFVFILALRKVNNRQLADVDELVATVIVNCMVSILFWIGPILFVVYNGMKYLKNFQFGFGFLAGNLIIILVLNYLLMVIEPYCRWLKQKKNE